MTDGVSEILLRIIEVVDELVCFATIREHTEDHMHDELEEIKSAIEIEGVLS